MSVAVLVPVALAAYVTRGAGAEWSAGVNALLVVLPASGVALISGALAAVFRLIPER